MVEKTQWAGFKGRLWKEEINVRDFIQNNYTPYDGDESFLAGPTEATNKLWGKLQELQKEERAKGGVLDMETKGNFVFRSKGSLAKQIGWYLLAFCLITCIVNSINCIWVAVAGLLVPDFIYNIGTTVLNGGISMVIFFFVNKIIFPEGEKAAK